MTLKKGQIVEAKIKNRWQKATIKRINNVNIGITFNDEYIVLKPTQIREMVTSGARKESKTSPNPKTIVKPTIIDNIEEKLHRPGTKHNPWIPLADLRSQNMISTLSYTDKVKFEGIIKLLIDALK